MESLNIATTFQQFILALIALLNHPSTPERARSLFRAAACELVGDANITDEALPAALASAFSIPPELEAKRAEYTTLAESFIALLGFNQNRIPDALDCGDVASGINSHLITLHKELDWFDARTLRLFYAPLRLHAEMQAAEREAKAQAYKQSRLGKRSTLTPNSEWCKLIGGGDKLSGVITDKVTPGVPMAITKDGDAWIGQVTQKNDESRVEIETVNGRNTFWLSDIKLVALDWPKEDEAQQARGVKKIQNAIHSRRAEGARPTASRFIQ